MGQARRRGNFEERKAAALYRKREENAKLLSIRTKSCAKQIASVGMALALTGLLYSTFKH